jgi:1-deoxy-D-xylulose-5-phosphate reductoisomerase
MRTPIAYALGFPERLESGVGALDLFKIGRLDFQKPDMDRFPCLRLAYEALRMEGTAATVLNAANEIAVEAFLGKKIGFMDIPALIEATLQQTSIDEVTSLDQLIGIDVAARETARAWMQEKVC